MKKIKIILITIFFINIFFSCSFFAGVKNEQMNAISIYLNGSKIKINTILDKETLYVPINEICYYFHCDFKKDDNNKTINFTRSQALKEKPESIDRKSKKKEKNIKIEKSNYQTMIDGIYLFITPIIYNNTFYIPLEYFAESFEKSMKWNYFKNSVKVNDYPLEYIGSINGQKIKKRFFYERYHSKYGRLEAGNEQENKDKKGEQNKNIISEEQKIKLKEEVFDNIVEMMLASQKSDEYGVVLDDEIKARINYYLKMTVNKFGGIEGFRDKFKKDGITYQDAINYFTYGVIKEELMEKVSAGIEPPEEMMKAYYENSKDSFIKPAKAIVKHILIPTKDKDMKDLSKEKIEEQKKQAEMILQKIQNGEDFELLRQKYSEDYYPDTNIKDHPEGFEVIEGYLAIAKTLEDAVFKLKPGEISDVVYTYRGFHIIKLLSRSEQKQKTFAESEERIKKDLAYMAKLNYLAELMQEWKQDSVIEKQL